MTRDPDAADRGRPVRPAGPIPDGHDTGNATIGGDPVVVDVTVTRAVAALPCRKAWLTAWGRDAADAVRAVAPGLPDWPVLDTAAEGGWWKQHAVGEFPASTTDLTTVVRPDEEMLPGGHAEQATAFLAGRGIAGLVMPVNPFTGTTLKQDDMVRDWIRQRPGDVCTQGAAQLRSRPQMAASCPVDGPPGAVHLAGPVSAVRQHSTSASPRGSPSPGTARVSPSWTIVRQPDKRPDSG